MDREIQEALDWADQESEVCFSSGTGHHEAKILAAAVRSLTKALEEEKAKRELLEHGALIETPSSELLRRALAAEKEADDIRKHYGSLVNQAQDGQRRAEKGGA